MRLSSLTIRGKSFFLFLFFIQISMIIISWFVNIILLRVKVNNIVSCKKKFKKHEKYLFFRDAEDAVHARDGYDFDGHRLRVEFTRGVGPRGPGGRPINGGWVS